MLAFLLTELSLGSRQQKTHNSTPAALPAQCCERMIGEGPRVELVCGSYQAPRAASAIAMTMR